ncbi:hypothetical protein NIES267_05710 [Calothrix parasitica NIES-267]|uniref:Uncharacterized protein n=1 Tax=Calothrix parasitica NIES-267 TaxID=1973488 RepID=A0A1Z4LIQ3_9CYAN|nr:hypothetical protein NIES267_05710 [Calothrix parasitica NIES-267]
MKSLLKSFWLFLIEPVKFALEWISNRNNIHESLFPIILLGIISVTLLNGLSVIDFRKNHQTFRSLRNVLKSLIQLFFQTCLYLGYFFTLGVFSGKNYLNRQNIINYFKLIFTMFGFFSLSLLFTLLFFTLFYLTIKWIKRLIVFCKLQPELSSNIDNDKSYFKYSTVGCIFVIISIFYWFTIFKNSIVVTSIFLDISWWLIIIVSIFYSIFSFLLRSAVAIFFSDSGNNQQSS